MFEGGLPSYCCNSNSYWLVGGGGGLCREGGDLGRISVNLGSLLVKHLTDGWKEAAADSMCIRGDTLTCYRPIAWVNREKDCSTNWNLGGGGHTVCSHHPPIWLRQHFDHNPLCAIMDYAHFYKALSVKPYLCELDSSAEGSPIEDHQLGPIMSLLLSAGAVVN